MRKSLFISTLLVALAVVLFFSVGCQTETEDSETIETEISSVTPATTAAATPAVTAAGEEAELVNQVYTNDKFGYKITLPAGYTADVEEFRSESYAGGGRDTVRIMDENGELFAIIVSPPPEVGWQGYLWDQAEETEISVAGSDKVLYMEKAAPDEAMGNTNNIAMVSWGAEFGEGLADNDQFAESGIIYMNYSNSENDKLETFEEMVRTFRFI